MRKIYTGCIFIFAYLYAAIETIFSLPPYVYITTFFVVCAAATLATLTPHSVAKMRLATSSQSLEDYARFLQYTQASGNDDLGQRVYKNLLPTIEQQPTEIQQAFHEIVYPQERVAALLNFWSGVYAKQPNSREANAALAVLSYQTFDDEKFQQYLHRWKEIEPNDPRLVTFTEK